MPGCNDIKAFIPALDYEKSLGFYAAVGFTRDWSSPQATQFALGDRRFILQNYYLKEFAENCMLSLNVSDLDSWWQHLQALYLSENFPGSRIQPPAMQPWGLRVLFMHDPSGVLWHLVQD